MNYILNLTILVVGLSGLVAQVLVLRELFVNSCGNELTLGIVLANWVILEALGVFIAGKYVDRIKDKISIFIVLQLIFSVSLPTCLYLARVVKNILGITYGETLGLYQIFYASLFILLPLAFCHGALFSAGCKIYSLRIKASAPSIGRVYAWETLGTILGGIILTYIFIPQLNSFQVSFIIILSNLLLCLVLLKYSKNTILKYVISGAVVLSSLLFISPGASYINKLSINQQYRAVEVLDYRNSVYGNIVVTKKEEQRTFFYNGTPLITVPYPDITFVEDLGHLPLLFHRSPRDVLIIGKGAGGLINEILKHPLKKLDYAELDPLIIEILKKYPSVLTRTELTDKRVHLINTDGRFFLRTSTCNYDIILIGISNPSDLSTNRLFTKEFFSLAKKRLNADGILAFWLPGSLTYLSQELRDVNFSILNALKETYSYVRIIPGDYNIFLASTSGRIMEVTPDLISHRISERNLKTNILAPSYIDYRLNKKWLDSFMQNSRHATRAVNQDLKPIAVFEMLKFSNKKFSDNLVQILGYLQNITLGRVFIIVFMITLLFFLIFYRKPKLRKLNITYSIATTGFFGMLMNLALIFCFQVFYGYLYHRIGILISVFMAGIALGSIFMTAVLEKIKNALKLFMVLEFLIILFSYLVAFTITSGIPASVYTGFIFTLLFFVSGLLMGLEFPLASKIYSRDREAVGEVSGMLYAADLTGGWLAGIMGGIILLPILGFFNTCMVIIMFKLSSLALLIFVKSDNPA